MDLGIDTTCRETLLTSVAMGEKVLATLGFGADETRHIATTFRDHDERLLAQQHAVQHSEEKLIQSARDTARELEALLKDDLRNL